MGLRLFVIERSYDVWLVLTTRCRNSVPMALFWGSRLCPWSPTVALHVLLNLGLRSCADVSLFAQTSQLCSKPSCRLTQDGQRYNKALNLVPRGTQIFYSATVDLVAEFGGITGGIRALGSICARFRDFIGHKYYFTLPIGECKDGGELMMSSAR
ncbi:hypothetical protein M9H77_02257 [Catharanthus roseus]|uniref:Uncharacterized protein n=1 Tax=Catharanthus roseus TaxID=4058 RepID=A0ACC0C802_CATRO|nr:hypothetical protein M9H77_02257 [Catharanthus roseus]